MSRNDYVPEKEYFELLNKLIITEDALTFIVNCGYYKTGNEDDMYSRAKEALKEIGEL
jgi:hypothetical protein